MHQFVVVCGRPFSAHSAWQLHFFISSKAKKKYSRRSIRMLATFVCSIVYCFQCTISTNYFTKKVTITVYFHSLALLSFAFVSLRSTLELVAVDFLHNYYIYRSDVAFKESIAYQRLQPLNAVVLCR